jgi:hypothetical protein
MEEVRLIFDNKLVKAKSTVSDLHRCQKERYPEIERQHENIVVLRAREPEDWEMEEQLAKDQQLSNGFAKNIRRNASQNEIIEILSDDENDGKRASPENNTRSPTVGLTSEDDNEEAELPQYTGLSGYSSGHVASLPQAVTNQIDTPQHSEDEQQKADNGSVSPQPHEELHKDYPEEYQQAQPLSSAFDEQMNDYENENHNTELLDNDEDQQRSGDVLRDDHLDEDYQLLMSAGELDSASYQQIMESRRQPAEPSQAQIDKTVTQVQEVVPLLQGPIDAQEVQDSSLGAAEALARTPPSARQVFPQADHVSITLNAAHSGLPSNIDYQAYRQPVETYVSFNRLPPAIQQSFNYSQWYQCSSPSCQRSIVLKPWTRYHGTSFAPLCTSCTRLYLSGVNPDPAALQQLEREVVWEYNQKERRQIAGVSQNPEPDAPFDYSGLVQGPISHGGNQPQPASNLATTMQQMQRTFMNDINSASESVGPLMPLEPLNYNMAASTVHAPHGFGVYTYGPQHQPNHDNHHAAVPAPTLTPFEDKTVADHPTKRANTPIRDEGPSQAIQGTPTMPAPTGMLASGFSWIKKKFSPKSKKIEDVAAVQGPVLPLSIQDASVFQKSPIACDAGNNDEFDISSLIDDDNPLAVPGPQHEEAVQYGEVARAGMSHEGRDDETEEAFEDDAEKQKQSEEDEKANYHAAMIADVKLGDEGSDDEYVE